MIPDLEKLVPLDLLSDSNISDLNAINKMGVEARDYLMSHRWCSPIYEIYFGAGIAGIVVAFLFFFPEKIGDADDALWVVVGDLPSAYFVVDNAKTPIDAIKVYCELMEDWLDAVRNGGDLSKVFPIAAKPTEENVRRLSSRISFIRNETVPSL